jgi:hypothetical protein
MGITYKLGITGSKCLVEGILTGDGVRGRKYLYGSGNTLSECILVAEVLFFSVFCGPPGARLTNNFFRSENFLWRVIF